MLSGSITQRISASSTHFPNRAKRQLGDAVGALALRCPLCPVEAGGGQRGGHNASSRIYGGFRFRVQSVHYLRIKGIDLDPEDQKPSNATFCCVTECGGTPRKWTEWTQRLIAKRFTCVERVPTSPLQSTHWTTERAKGRNGRHRVTRHPESCTRRWPASDPPGHLSQRLPLRCGSGCVSPQKNQACTCDEKTPVKL